MAEEKIPLHELLSEKLIAMTSNLAEERYKVSFAYEVLEMLQRGKMKASDAHQLAERHDELPAQLETAGQKGLAGFAREVLEDLRGRKDEKREFGKLVRGPIPNYGPQRE